MSVPECLSGYFDKNQNTHNYNPRRESNLLLPRVKLELGKWQFINFPGEIKMLSSLKSLTILTL